MTDAASDATTTDRPGAGARRFGYVVSLLVNAAMLIAINSWPGWEALPFLTDDTPAVLGIVNASLIVSMAANLLYVAYDPRWFKALGDVVTTAVGLAAVIRLWQVFPFSFDDEGIDWTLVVRILLVVGIVGSIIGIVVRAVALLRELFAPR